MLSFDIDFKPLKLALEKQSQNIDKAVHKGLLAVVEQMRKDSLPKVPKDTEGLINSWRKEIQGLSNIEVGYDIIYAMYQHQGRRADGTHIIRNRPAGGQSFYLKETIDQNLQKYFALFAKTVGKEMKYL